MNETNITRTIMLALSNLKARVFRNNTGTGWVGEVQRLKDGSLLIKNPRPLHAGLCNGSSDLIGWTQRTITPDMVGKTVAIFTAIEVKTDRGRATPDQLNFIEQIRNSGGIAGIARNPDDARKIIENM